MSSSNRAISFQVVGPDRISQRVGTLYNSPGDQALHWIIDTRYLGYHWNLNFSHKNNTNIPFPHDVEEVVGLTIRHEHESTQRWNVEAAFRGISFGFENTNRVLTSVETSRQTTRRTRIEIPPNTWYFLYQRVFYFQTELWFVVDAWGKNWTVGLDGTDQHGRNRRLVRTSRVKVVTEERRSESLPLQGLRTGPTRSNVQFRWPSFPPVRQWGNLPRRAQDQLRRCGISPHEAGGGPRARLMSSSDDHEITEDHEINEITEDHEITEDQDITEDDEISGGDEGHEGAPFWEEFEVAEKTGYETKETEQQAEQEAIREQEHQAHELEVQKIKVQGS
ncbi:hypothetical protein DFH27DRAFT_149310 [Peziza echinospora]|nr:hypothetical protein DFH27DRAFT_149310 [Peziza echinospora]